MPIFESNALETENEAVDISLPYRSCLRSSKDNKARTGQILWQKQKLPSVFAEPAVQLISKVFL